VTKRLNIDPSPYSKKDHIMISAAQANKANIATVTKVRFVSSVIYNSTFPNGPITLEACRAKRFA
jgi:hypothetical protein